MKIADTVVHRHPCNCPNASRPLAAGEHPEHRFDVDGEEFPWFISEEGPRFTRLSETMYSVSVEIFLVDTKTKSILLFSTDGGRVPVLGGRAFPWMITRDGYVFAASSSSFPTLKLAFFARSVDTDGPVDDIDHIYTIDGERIG